MQDSNRALIDEAAQAAADRCGRRLTEQAGSLTDRFERRLTEETSALRGEMSTLRVDVQEGFTDLRVGLAGLRTDMAALQAGLRTEIVAVRFDVLKWSFVFWVGQLSAIAGLLAYLT